MPLTPQPAPVTKKVLGQPSQYPADLLSWLYKQLSGNKLLQIGRNQLPLAHLPGSEIGYDQITATVNIAGTTSAAPTAVIPGSAYKFDGSPVMVEFYSPEVASPSTAAASTRVGLYEGSTLIALLGFVVAPTAAQVGMSMVGRMRFTPAAGLHTYSLKAWVTVLSGTPAVVAGTGSGGANGPAYLRFTKV